MSGYFEGRIHTSAPLCVRDVPRFKRVLWLYKGVLNL